MAHACCEAPGFKPAYLFKFFRWYDFLTGHWNGVTWIPVLSIVFSEAQYRVPSYADSKPGISPKPENITFLAGFLGFLHFTRSG